MGLGASRPPRLRFLQLALVAVVGAACTTPPGEGGDGGPMVGPTTSPTAGAPSILRLSTLEPDSLDPIELDAPHELLLAHQVFDGLVAYEPETLAAVPALASNWKVKEQGSVIVFRLREGIRFHDGTPVTAGDFVTSWSRLADPLVAAPYGFLLEQVAGYDAFQRDPVTQLAGLEAPDERTFVVRLRTPWPGFVSVAGHPALSPVPSSADSGTFGTEPVGTGPYRLRNPLGSGAPLVLERFPRFYGEPPKVDELHFEIVSRADDAWPDFLAGELDEATIPASALPDALTTFGSAGVVPLGRLLYCGFNQEEERLTDARLGLAASLALDRPALAAEVYGGLPLPATGLVPPSIPGAQEDPCGARCEQDVEEARKLVGALPRETKTFALDYVASPVGDVLAAGIRAQLQEVGFRVTLRRHDEREYLGLLLQGAQELFCLVWTADHPRQEALLEPLLLPGSEDNHAGIDDPGLTGLLAQAREQRSAAKRQRLYAEAERRALARMHLIPVVWFRSHLAVQPYVEGFAVDPLGMFDAAAFRIES